MFAEFIPSLRDALMPYHRSIGILSALLTLPVLAWSGSQFFVSAWNGFRNHNTNMDTLVALGTGAAWAYSAVVVLAPHLFPAGTAGMYFEVAVIVIALILLGQALEVRAKSRRRCIRKLGATSQNGARHPGGREVDSLELLFVEYGLFRKARRCVDCVILKANCPTVGDGHPCPFIKTGRSVTGASVND